MLSPMSPVRLRLADILRERQITQTRLSEMTGLSENAISKLTGSPRQIRMVTLDIICHTLNIEPGDLFVREQEKAS